MSAGCQLWMTTHVDSDAARAALWTLLVLAGNKKTVLIDLLAISQVVHG